ncbi:MAG: uridine kinase [Christensenellales bacterium]
MEILKIQEKLGDVVRTCYNMERINRVAKEQPEELIKVSEQIVADQIDRVVEQVILGKYKFVFIAGPSCSGKTTTAKIISKRLKERKVNGLVVSLDDFFIDLDKAPKLPDGRCDKENITKIDLPFFNKFFNDIIKTNEAMMPEFDFATDKRKPELIPVKIKKNDVIIVEGTHALNPKLLFDHSNDSKVLKVFVCVNSEYRIGSNILISPRKLRLIRRITRDLQTRGQSVHETVTNWNEVCKGEDIYIIPYKNDAHFLIDTTHIYEPLIYDKYLPELLAPLKEVSYAEELLGIFGLCGSLDKSLVPDRSLLWEFLVR